MAIILDIAPELEKVVQSAAAKQGMTPDKYITGILKEYLQNTKATTVHLSPTEATLLEQINLGITEETWQRYHILIEKRRAEQLAPGEQEILIQISNEIEKANARRIEALIKLAKLRHVSLDVLMNQLGIKRPSYV
ncbi:MAG: hypothetical protein U0350_42995 [Caldilineaceae bacterium]